MNGWCRLFRVRGLKTRCTTPIESKAATVVPLSQCRGRTVTDDVARAAHMVVRPHSSAGRAPAADSRAGARCGSERVGMMRDGSLDGRLWQDTHELNGAESDARSTSIVARPTST